MASTVALGSTNQTININGFSSYVPPTGGVPQYSAGGIFAQPSNMGRYWCWDFSVVSDVQLKLGYRLCHNVTLTAGYDFLFWSSVVRPGAQLDRQVNISQSSLLSSNAFSGPDRPAAPLSRSDFFANGFNLGLDIRW
jgi:hypothetical protein